jgi:IS4 transposase
VLAVVWCVKTKLKQHKNSLLEPLESLLWNKREIRTFRMLLSLFLNCKLRTLLENVKGISASTASRFMSCEHVPDAVFWEVLNNWQFEQFKKLSRRDRRGDVILKLDLTCLEKRGQKIPFARVFNSNYGIQLVVLHACVGKLSFPLGYRIYKGKATVTVVSLALELLTAFPPSLWTSRVVIMADAGFGSNDFIQGCIALGYKRLLVGLRNNRKLMNQKSVTELKRRGEPHRLKDLPQLESYITWADVKRDNTMKRFYLLSTFKAGGAYLARRYRKRWLIESFFKSIKYDFGLKEARLRTKGGIRLWIFFACLAYSLAKLEQALKHTSISLNEAAETVRTKLPVIHFIHLLIDLEAFNYRHSQYLKLNSG